MYEFSMIFFLAQLAILYIVRIEQENNVDDDFTEDLRTFIISDFLSILENTFQGCQQYSLVMYYVDG